MPHRKSICSLSTGVAVGDFMMTVSVRIAESSTLAMDTGISMPSWRSMEVTTVAVEPQGRQLKKMGPAVVTSPMR